MAKKTKRILFLEMRTKFAVPSLNFVLKAKRKFTARTNGKVPVYTETSSAADPLITSSPLVIP